MYRWIVKGGSDRRLAAGEVASRLHRNGTRERLMFNVGYRSDLVDGLEPRYGIIQVLVPATVGLGCRKEGVDIFADGEVVGGQIKSNPVAGRGGIAGEMRTQRFKIFLTLQNSKRERIIWTVCY